MRINLPPHVDPQHPVNRQDYAVYTPPVAAMATVLGDWIEQRQPGGYIYGPSRFGKSRGVKWHLRSILNERFGMEMPLRIWVRPAESHVSESRFWKSWLETVGHRYVDERRNAGDRLALLRDYLIAAALECKTNFVVLVIDEAHEMTVREWKWLMSLQNMLDWRGFRMSVFSVGSHQMDYQYDLLGRASYAHVAARFMVAHWPFPGLSDKDELEFVLLGYDTASEWPAGSGTSYLAHFAPSWYDRGERLHHVAETFWRVLEALLPAGYAGDIAIPMQHVAWSIESQMLRLAAGDDWETATSEEAWLQALGRTQFSDHMRLISAGVRRKRRQQVP